MFATNNISVEAPRLGKGIHNVIVKDAAYAVDKDGKVDTGSLDITFECIESKAAHRHRLFFIDYKTKMSCFSSETLFKESSAIKAIAHMARVIGGKDMAAEASETVWVNKFISMVKGKKCRLKLIYREKKNANGDITGNVELPLGSFCESITSKLLTYDPVTDDKLLTRPAATTGVIQAMLPAIDSFANYDDMLDDEVEEKQETKGTETTTTTITDNSSVEEDLF